MILRKIGAKVLKSSEVFLINFSAYSQFQFSESPLYKYPNR